MTQGKSQHDVKGTKTLIVIDTADTSNFLEIIGDRDVGGMRTVNYVWDIDTLANVKMTQPLTAAGIVDVDLASKGVFWAETRIEWSGDNPIYIGYNETLGATTSGTDWEVKKLTYSGDNPTRIQLQTTSWDLRAVGWS